MNIQGIMLVTGEELIAEIGLGVGDVQHIKSPLMLKVNSGPNGIECTFYPWSVIADHHIIPLQKHAIVALYNVPQEVQDAYLQNVSGLQIVSVPPSRILNG